MLEKYEPGREQDSMDKQILRNYLETLDWNRQYPPPVLDQAVLERVSPRVTSRSSTGSSRNGRRSWDCERGPLRVARS